MSNVIDMNSKRKKELKSEYDFEAIAADNKRKELRLKREAKSNNKKVLRIYNIKEDK